MGSIRFVLYKISKLLPKKYRKPIILISSTLGLFIFYNIILRWTNSKFLLIARDMVLDSYTFLITKIPLVILAPLAILIILAIALRYWKKYQAFLSASYLAILILGFLPMVIK